MPALRWEGKRLSRALFTIKCRTGVAIEFEDSVFELLPSALVLDLDLPAGESALTALEEAVTAIGLTYTIENGTVKVCARNGDTAR